MAATDKPAAAVYTKLQLHAQATGYQELKFNFPLAGTTVFRQGDDLGFTPAGGEPLRLPDFFKTDSSSEPPRLLFADLPEMTTADLLERLAVDPASDEPWEALYIPQTPLSGGVGDYADVPGALVNGIDVLGTLGTDFYSPKILSQEYSDAFPTTASSLTAARDDGGHGGVTNRGTQVSPPPTPAGRSVIPFSEDGLMAVPRQTGNLSLSQHPDATYALKDGGGGRYGLFRLNPDGSWVYYRTTDINMMAEGQMYTENFPVIISLPDGSSVEWLVEVDITGNNDAPLLNTASSGVDDDALAFGTGIRGTITGRDVDEGDGIGAFRMENAPTARLVEGGLSTPVDINDYGTLQVNTDGSWSFAAQTPAQRERLLALAPGRRLVVTVDVTASDTHGADGSTTLTITVTGTNQAPEFNAETLSTQIGEDALIAAAGNFGGRITAYDHEDDAAGINVAYTALTRQGLYGTFTLATDGTWNYALNPGVDINFMAQGRSYVETFTVTAFDSHGATAQQQFSLFILGDNDAPVITGFSQSALDLGATDGVVLVGRISATDADEDDSVGNYRINGPVGASVNGVPVNLADYGELLLNADGSWRFTAQTPEQLARLEALPVGGVLSLTLTVLAQDTHGGSAGKSITIEVNGNNNVPVLIQADLSATITEDALIGAGRLTGTLSATDADNDTLIYSLAGSSAGTYGALTLSAGGGWTYVPTRDINFMVEGQAYTETFRIRVVDGKGGVDEQLLTITITGENDAPVVGAVSIAPVDTELHSGVVFSGKVPVTDPDAGDTAVITQGSITAIRGGIPVNPTDYGVFTLNAGGNWTFQAQTQSQKDNMLGLAVGENLVITVPVTATDIQGGTGTSDLVITVAGTNQEPVFVGAGLSAGTTEEALMAAPELTGQLEAVDPDSGDVLVFGLKDGEGNGLYGTFSVNPDGTWTYTRTGDLGFLETGESVVERFTVTVTDGHGTVTEQTFSLTIGGDAGDGNSAPMLVNANATATDTDLYGGLELSGTIAGTDADGDAVGYAAGTVTALRGGTAVNIADYGILVMSADGSWSFEAVTQSQKDMMLGLAEGESLVITMPVTGMDPSGATGGAFLTITVAGTNQTPVFVAAGLNVAAGEDAVLDQGSLSGRLAAADPDTGDALTYSVKPGTGTGAYGIFSVTADGEWTYVPTDSLNRIPEGQTVTETFIAVVSDGHGGNAEQIFTLTITGDNDAPVLQAATATTTDAAMYSGVMPAGSIVGIDPDGDGIVFGVGAATATLGGSTVDLSDYGALTMNPDGSWAFEARTQAQKNTMLGLAEGETLVVSLPVTGTDTHGATGAATLTITVVGTNQAPELQSATAAGNDAAMYSGTILSGSITGTDPEGDGISYAAGTPSALRGSAAVNAADYGTLTMNADGSWTFGAVTQAQKDTMLGLADGETLIITVPVIGTDTHGAPGAGTLTITVTGTNQDPVFNATTLTASADEDDVVSAGSIGGRLTATDPDTGNTLSYSLKAGTGTGTYGSFRVDPDGTWIYTPTAGINRLAEGETYTETFTAVVSDGHGGSSEQTFTLTLTGDNDAPVLQNATAAGNDAAIYGGTILSGSITGTDPEGDGISYAAGTPSALRGGTAVNVADYGTLTMNADGSWTFGAVTQTQKDTMLSLADGETLVITVPVIGTDTHGAPGAGTLTITVTGTNQAPVFHAETLSAQIGEDALIAASGSLGGVLSAGDPESDAVTYTAITRQGLYGTFTLAVDGNWTYALNPGLDINFMAQGRNYLETFIVTVSDSHGAASQQQFTLTIAGDNDVPVITGVSHGATDLDAADGVVLTGRVLATDVDAGDSIANYRISGPVGAAVNGVTVDLADYGELILNTDGSWEFKAQTPEQQANLQSLPTGSVLSVTAVVEAQDTNGGSGNGTITIEVNGNNNAPVLDPSGLSAAITEDALIGAGKLTGAVSATDSDGDTLTYSLAGSGAGNYGTLTLAADGSWTYVPTGDINFMVEGQTYSETFRIQVGDGRGGLDEQNLTITITGDNDAPVLRTETATTTDVALGGGTSLSGSITGTDPEGDAISYSADAATATINGNTVDLSDYGVLTMNDDGTWSFEARTQTQRDNMLGLAEGENLIITVPVHGRDTHGARGDNTLTINVTGTNQAPDAVVTVENPTVIPTHEDAMLVEGFSLKGGLSVVDPEGDAFTYSLLGASAGDPNSVLGLYGVLTVNPGDGSWTYVRFPGMDLNFMTQGQDYVDTFTVFMKDSLGAMAERKISFAIAGDNDAPIITGTTQGTVTLDPLLGVTADLRGRILASDVDEGDIVGHYDIIDGSLALDISGQRVELDKLGDVLDGLLDSADPLLNAAGTLLNTILGQLGKILDNTAGLGDLLVLDSDSGEWTLAAGPLNAVLNLLEGITDALRNIPGLDDILLDTLLVSLPWLDFKRNEDLLSLKVTVAAQDNHGAPAETEITIGILGGNNAPQFGAAVVTSGIGEDELTAAHFITGTLSATDGENDPLTYALTDGGHGRYGTLTVSADGTWTYTLTRDINFLAEGEVRIEDFTVMVSDGHGGQDQQTVRIQITGDNDAPVFESASLTSVVREDDVTSRGTASGQLSAADPDSGASLTYSLKGGTGAGAYGVFSVSPTGAWTYTPAPGLAGLSRGQLAVETCTVVVVDEHGLATEQTFTLTVVGTDDVPLVDVSGALTTDETAMLAGGFSLSGGLNAHDPGDTYTYTLLGGSAGNPDSAVGLYGTLTLNPVDGSWTYARIPGMDLNFMAEGQNYVDAFSVLVRDAATGAMVEKTISFSITGRNDAPVLKGVLQDQAGLVNPTNNVTDLTGRILAFDVDQGDTMAFSKSGSATLLLDGAPLVLNVTNILTSTLNVVSANLTGPLLGGLVGSLVSPLLSGTIGPLLNAALNPIIGLLGGALIDLDEETGQWTVLSNNLTIILNGLDGVVNAVLGTLIAALDANPLISNTVLNNIKNDLLAELPLLGFNRTDSALALDIPFQVQDSHGAADTATIAISILGGLNHAPAFAPATLTPAPVNEDAQSGARFITGTLSASDQDGDTPAYALVTGGGGDWGGHGKYGSLTLDAAGGKWTYTLTRDIGFMAQGESYVETFRVVARDGRGGQDVQTLRITITGENDAPVFDVASLSSLVTDNDFTDRGFVSGQLSATDPDSGAVLTYSLKNGDGTGAYGALSVSPTGEWRYTPSTPPVRGQVETETFTVVVTDEHGAATEQTFTLTVVGTNRAPEATVTAEASAVVTDEDALLADGFSLRGSLRLHDPEGDEPGTYALLDASGAEAGSVAGLYGILTLDPSTGNWTYVRFPGMDLNFMTEGETYTDTFRVLVEDSLGATAEREIVFSITGRNDAPVITGVSQGTITLDPLLGVTADLTGRVLAFDGDEGDTVGHYDIVDGSLALDISGKRVELDGLGDVLDGLLDPADPLLNAVGTVLNTILGRIGEILDNTAGLGDLLVLDSDTGQWTLAAGPLNALLNLLEGITDALRAVPGVDAILDPLLVGLPWLDFKPNEDLLSLKVTVAAQDNHGAPAQETEITIGILGGNNAPRFDVPEVTRDIGEADLIAAHYITGTLSATDGENDALSYALSAGGHGRYGTLTVSADGTWTYTLTKDVGGLTQGETYAETFTVLVSDGHGGQDEQTLRINIAGSGAGSVSGFQASSSLEPLAEGTAVGLEPPVGQESAEVSAVPAETQTSSEQAGTAHQADSEPPLSPSQPQTAGDEAENRISPLISQEEGTAPPSAVMDTLNGEYGRLNALLLEQAAGMEPREENFLHTLLEQKDFPSLYFLPDEDHTTGAHSAFSPVYQAHQDVPEGAEEYGGQDSGTPHELAVGDFAAELGLVVEAGADALQSLSGGELPPMDKGSIFDFVQSPLPEQNTELLALQVALQNG